MMLLAFSWYREDREYCWKLFFEHVHFEMKTPETQPLMHQAAECIPVINTTYQLVHTGNYHRCRTQN